MSVYANCILMKRTFFLLVMIAILSPTLSVAAVEAPPPPAREESPSVLALVARVIPLGATVMGGYVAMKRYPEHKKPIFAVMGLAAAALAYFDPYALLTLAGPAYCFAATPYFGHCPCCPPGCMWIMGC